MSFILNILHINTEASVATCAVKSLKASKNQPTFGDGESWRPLWSQNVKTNAAVAVDIWVVDSCGKCNLKTDGEERYVGVRKGGRWEEQQETKWHKAVVCFSRQEALHVTHVCCFSVCLCTSMSVLPLAVWRGSLWGSVWSRRKPRSGKDCHSNAGRKTPSHHKWMHTKWNRKLNSSFALNQKHWLTESWPSFWLNWLGKQ